MSSSHDDDDDDDDDDNDDDVDENCWVWEGLSSNQSYTVPVCDNT